MQVQLCTRTGILHSSPCLLCIYDDVGSNLCKCSSRPCWIATFIVFVQLACAFNCMSPCACDHSPWNYDFGGPTNVSLSTASLGLPNYWLSLSPFQAKPGMCTWWSFLAVLQRWLKPLAVVVKRIWGDPLWNITCRCIL